MGKKTIKINAILNTIQTIMNMIFPLITFPYVSRVLSVESIGKYNFSQSVVSYFVLIAGLGINTYAIREGAGIRDEKVKMNAFAADVFSINIYSTLISMLILLIFVFSINKLHTYARVIFILSSQIVFITLGRNWIYVIYEEYLFITIRTILFQFLSMILLFFLVKEEDDVCVYSFVSIVGIIGNNIVNLLFNKKYGRIKFKFKPDLSHLKPILLIFSTSVSVVIYSNSDLTMLGIFGTDYVVGLYGISVKVYNIVKQIVAAILTVTIPRFSYYSRNGKAEEYDDLFNKVFNMLILILLPVSTGLLMVSRQCVYFLAGGQYIEAATSLSILSVAMIFNLVAYMFGYCVLIPHREEKIFFLATFISAVTNAGLNLILIPHYMQNAAAFTTLIAESITAWLCYRNSKKYLKSLFIQNNFFCTVVGCIAIVGICSVVKKYMYNELKILLISVSTSIVIFVYIQVLLRNKFFKNILDKIKNDCR